MLQCMLLPWSDLCVDYITLGKTSCTILSPTGAVCASNGICLRVHEVLKQSPETTVTRTHAPVLLNHEAYFNSQLEFLHTSISSAFNKTTIDVHHLSYERKLHVRLGILQTYPQQ